MTSVTLRSLRSAALVLALIPSAAFAGIGKVDLVQQATRIAGDGTKHELKAGTEIEIKDTISVAKGNLKLTLNDSSVIMLGEGSELYISEADFKGQERTGFSAKLLVGKVWSKVAKMLSGSGAKFEVTTERAVAGVRGTIFRVDTAKIVEGVRPRQPWKTVVRVTEGLVDVSAKVKAAAMGQVPKGPRKEVPGPQEITKEAWEQKFVQLQANQQVTIGEELWKEASYEPAAKADAFARFVDKNQ